MFQCLVKIITFLQSLPPDVRTRPTWIEKGNIQKWNVHRKQQKKKDSTENKIKNMKQKKISLTTLYRLQVSYLRNTLLYVKRCTPQSARCPDDA